MEWFFSTLKSFLYASNELYAWLLSLLFAACVWRFVVHCLPGKTKPVTVLTKLDSSLSPNQASKKRCRLTFSVDGKSIALLVPGWQFDRLQTGDEGMLSYKGRRFLSFDGTN